MSSYILTGSGAVGTITPGPYQGIQIDSITFNIPMDETTTTDPSVTISGSVTGVYTFHNSSELGIRFRANEVVSLSTNGFTEEYAAIIKYTVFGDSSAYRDDLTRSAMPLPSRLTRNPRDGS